MIHGGDYVTRTIDTRTLGEENGFYTVDLPAGCYHLTAHDGDMVLKERWSGEFDINTGGLILADGDTIEIHIDERDRRLTYYLLDSGWIFVRRVAFVKIGKESKLLLPTVAP